MSKAWPAEFDEALLRTMKQGHTEAAPFFDAYKATSGDTVHDIGGVAFRAIQMSRLLREFMSETLRKNLDRAATKARADRRVAKGVAEAPVRVRPAISDNAAAETVVHGGREYITASGAAMILRCSCMQVRRYDTRLVTKTGIHPKNPGDTVRKMYERASVIALAAAMKKSEKKPAPEAPVTPTKAADQSEIVMVDDVAYVRQVEVARMIGCTTKRVRELQRELPPSYGISPKVEPSVPLYDRANIIAFITKRAEGVSETGDGEWMIGTRACVTPTRATSLLGITMRQLTSEYPHRVERIYHPRKVKAVFYSRESVDALGRELAAERAAKAHVETPAAPPSESPAPKVNGAQKAPVLPMSALSFPAQLERLNRALEEGVIDEVMHIAKVRQITASMVKSREP